MFVVKNKFSCQYALHAGIISKSLDKSKQLNSGCIIDLMNERFDPDIARSENEGFGTAHMGREYGEKNKQEDPKLLAFMDSIMEKFQNDPEIYDFRGALIEKLGDMDKKEKEKLVLIANKHFKTSYCPHHEKPIEIKRRGDVSYDLNESNIDDFMIGDGLESLKWHIRTLTPEVWADFLETEAMRIRN